MTSKFLNKTSLLKLYKADKVTTLDLLCYIESLESQKEHLEDYIEGLRNTIRNKDKILQLFADELDMSNTWSNNRLKNHVLKAIKYFVRHEKIAEKI